MPWAHMGRSPVMHRRHNFTLALSNPGHHCLSALSLMVPEPWGRREWHRGLNKWMRTPGTLILSFHQSWEPALTVQHINRCSAEDWRNRSMNVENRLTLCVFGKIIIAVSPPDTCEVPMVWDHGVSTRFAVPTRLMFPPMAHPLNLIKKHWLP